MRKSSKLLIILCTIAIVFIPDYRAFSAEYIEKWEELKKYGLLLPEASDMKSAKRLIILSIQATAMMKGNWWTAHGMLGATRIPQEPEDLLYASIGYLSLFPEISGNHGTDKEKWTQWLLEKSFFLDFVFRNPEGKHEGGYNVS